MLFETSIILIVVALLIYSNRTVPPTPQPVWDRISFNPFSKPAQCPAQCRKYKFPDDYLTPSITMTGSCGYKQDTFVFPCPSTCCDTQGSTQGGLLARILERVLPRQTE